MKKNSANILASAGKKPSKAKTSTKDAVPSMGPSERESISIRKIMNGYIVRKTCDSLKDGYVETEFYTDKKPEIEMPKSK
jgi:hypothetical protein